MPSNRNLLVALGEVVVDWISIDPGFSLDDASEFVRCPGGNALNVAVAAARLGAKSRLIAKTGNDFHSAHLRIRLQEENVDIQYLYAERGIQTAQCYAARDANDEATYYNWPRPNAADLLTADEVTGACLADAFAIHSSGISFAIEPRRSAVIRAFENARAESILSSFDASFPGHRPDDAKEDCKHAMLLADCIKVNLAELLYWTDFNEAPEIVMQQMADAKFDLTSKTLAFLNENIDMFLREFDPKVLLLTLSQHGCYVIRRDWKVYCPPLVVQSFSSIGAGDGYIAGMLVELQRRNIGSAQVATVPESQWREIARYANAVGALATLKLTALDSFPNAQEVASLLSAAG